MNRLIIALIVAVALIFIICEYNKQNEETFDPLTKIKPLLEYDPDKLFTDVVIYNNSDDRMGLDKCLGSCDGTCVEFGQTGVAHCFPRNTPYDRNYYTIFRNYENEIDESDRSSKSLVFPNLR